MRWLLIPLFAFIGALIARTFFLDVVEEVTVRGAWALRSLLELDMDTFRAAMKTGAGKKIAGGFVVGALVGLAIAWAVGSKRRGRR